MAVTTNFIAQPRPQTAGFPVQFTDRSSTDVVDGTMVSWSWTFDDGSVSVTQNPSHIFASSGSYSVRLRATDSDGTTSQRTRQVVIRKKYRIRKVRTHQHRSTITAVEFGNGGQPTGNTYSVPFGNDGNLDNLAQQLKAKSEVVEEDNTELIEDIENRLEALL